MNKKLQAARKYLERGYSIIPTKPDKRPFLESWIEFQERQAEPQELEQWWRKWPNANIAIVCGNVSGVDVIDVDPGGQEHINKYLPETLETPVVETPRKGQHLYFQHTSGLSNGRFLPHVDFKTQGGYVVAPPSQGPNGSNYVWLPHVSIFDCEPAPLPRGLLSTLLNNNEHLLNKGRYRSIEGDVTHVRQHARILTEGRRDQDLFHIANSLVKTNTREHEIRQVLEILAHNCFPPFPLKEVQAKIKSALKRVERRERNLSREIFDWISVTKGYWSVTDCDRALQIVTKESMANRRVILHRLVKDGVLERHPSREGIFRRIEGEKEEVNFMAAGVKTVDVRLPFGIDRMVELMPGNIVTVAGEPNVGKTALLLNIIKDNQDKFKVHYFTSEMGASELRKRLLKFDDMQITDWKFKAWERSDRFGDVIVPGESVLNVIDFLEVYEDFWKVGGHLAEIHRKLDGAIAIVAIQKNPGTDTGLGGYRGLEKPRLYLAMSPGKLKIGKAKMWATTKNPNGLETSFKIVDGCKFIQIGGWVRG